MVERVHALGKEEVLRSPKQERERLPARLARD